MPNLRVATRQLLVLPPLLSPPVPITLFWHLTESVNRARGTLTGTKIGFGVGRVWRPVLNGNLKNGPKAPYVYSYSEYASKTKWSVSEKPKCFHFYDFWVLVLKPPRRMRLASLRLSRAPPIITAPLCMVREAAPPSRCCATPPTRLPNMSAGARLGMGPLAAGRAPTPPPSPPQLRRCCHGSHPHPRYKPIVSEERTVRVRSPGGLKPSVPRWCLGVPAQARRENRRHCLSYQVQGTHPAAQWVQGFEIQLEESLTAWEYHRLRLGAWARQPLERADCPSRPRLL